MRGMQMPRIEVALLREQSSNRREGFIRPRLNTALLAFLRRDEIKVISVNGWNGQVVEDVQVTIPISSKSPDRLARHFRVQLSRRHQIDQPGPREFSDADEVPHLGVDAVATVRWMHRNSS